VKVKASKAGEGWSDQAGGVNRKCRWVTDPVNKSELTGTVDIPAKALAGLSIRVADDYGFSRAGRRFYPNRSHSGSGTGGEDHLA